MAEEVVAGRYAIQEELGRGASATVFRARDTLLQRPVALKVISASLAADPEFKWRFEQEALLSAKLDHPHIVTVHDVGTLPDGRGFIAMRLLEGPSLDRLLTERGKLPPDQVVDLIKQLASALDYTHAAGLVHRDVKPSNVKVDASGWATLTDFGIARALDSARVTLPGLTIGTPRYMSPEQVRGEEASPATDVYSLGVMAYEMLAGRPPFEGDGTALMYKIVHEEPPPPEQFNPSLPPEIASVIGTALAKNPADRWPSAGAFASALAEGLSLSTARAAALSPDEMATRVSVPPPLAATVVAPADDATAVVPSAAPEVTAVAPPLAATASAPADPLPPGPVAVAPAAEGPPVPPKKGSRRGLLFALGGFAVIAALAGGVAVFALGGGDSNDDNDREQARNDDEEDDDATATARANTNNRRATQTAAARTPEAERTSGLGQLVVTRTATAAPPTPTSTATPTPTARGAVVNTPVTQPPTATPTPEPKFPTLVNFALCHSAPGCPNGLEDLKAGHVIYLVFQLSPPTTLPVEMDVYYDEVFEYTSPFSGSSSGAYIDTIPYAEHPGYLELEIYAGEEWVDTIWAYVN